jgi:hypothetical protein
MEFAKGQILTDTAMHAVSQYYCSGNCLSCLRTAPKEGKTRQGGRTLALTGVKLSASLGKSKRDMSGMFIRQQT